MKRIFCCYLLSIWLVMGGFAQTSGDSATVAHYLEEAEQMTQYLAFIFNTVGSAKTSPREKEVIISQSYLKVFRDAEVQVEDDLVLGRSTTTNKEVQAYLKDIDFFFRNVEFTFFIQTITPNLNEQGGGYLVVELERRLRGITVDGDSVNNSQARFIEINLYPESRMLKIASIYTSRLSEQEDLVNWWQALDPSWRRFIAPEIRLNDSLTLFDLMTANDQVNLGDTLTVEHLSWVTLNDAGDVLTYQRPGQDLHIGDSVRLTRYDTLVLNDERFLGQLRQVLRKRSLDLSGRGDLVDLSPLSKLRQLRELTISHTQVRDLSPLRNLAQLQRLDLSHTPVEDLQPLRYCDALQRLNVAHTQVDDLGVIAELPALQVLDLSFSNITSLAPLQNGPALTELDLSGTSIFNLDALATQTQLAVLNLSGTTIYDLQPLSELTQLRVLNCDRTNIADLAPLAGAKSLRLLRVDSTRVLSLRSLTSLRDLQKVYCDQTLVGRYEVDQFHQSRPDVMVVFASASLREWYNALPAAWQQLLWPSSKGTRTPPDREQLHALSQLDSLDLSGHKDIVSLIPIKALSQLTYLNLSFSGVDSLGPLSEAELLTELDCNHTAIRSLEPLRYLRRLARLDLSYTNVTQLKPLAAVNALTQINISGTQINNIVPLYGLSGLRRINADDTPLSTSQVRAYLKEQPECLIIFQTTPLQSWWQSLPPAWQATLQQAVAAQAPVESEDWHRMIYLIQLDIRQVQDLRSLEPLQPFLRIERLYLHGTSVSSLAPLATLSTLQELAFPQHRITDLTPLRLLDQLTLLDCENTPISDLSPLTSLLRLESLNCAGTQVEELDALEGLFQIQRVNCSNTEVKKLKPLYTLPRLQQVSCFNTRISERRIEKFKETRPQVEVVYY
jgi:Leucine-rich repeat (LRR) protein